MSEAREIMPASPFDVEPNFEISFPPLPRTVTEVAVILGEQNEVPDTPRLVEVVHYDPVIATAVLRRVNSVYYGLRRKVSNIRQAVFLLGFPEVANLVMTTGMMQVRDAVSSKEQVHVYEQIMRLSVGAAYYTQRLASYLDLPAKERAFTAGLLHAVGRLILLHNKPAEYEALWSTNEVGLAPSTRSERMLFGTTHAALGAEACVHWNLPDFFKHVIGNYLQPMRLELPIERIMTLTLAAAVAATEQLYLEDARLKVISIEPTVALRNLADVTCATYEELADLLGSERQQIRQYIETMVQQ